LEIPVIEIETRAVRGVDKRAGAIQAPILLLPEIIFAKELRALSVRIVKIDPLFGGVVDTFGPSDKAAGACVYLKAQVDIGLFDFADGAVSIRVTPVSHAAERCIHASRITQPFRIDALGAGTGVSDA
jgi:hypothetical protein